MALILCRLFTVTFLLSVWSQSNAQEYYRQSERDARFVSSGDSDSTVIQPGDSLYDTLRGLTSDTSLVLSSGHYQLEQYVLVSNLSDVRICGQEIVVISCNQNIGLVFVNMTGLVIDNVRIKGCGLSGTNLDHTVTEIRQFIDLFLVVYSQMRVALLLAHCENLQMNGVELYNNVGFGIVGVNIIGSSVISQITAVNNDMGGAVFIYQDYFSELYSNQLHQLTIKEGMFRRNVGISFNSAIYYDIESEYVRNLGYSIGGGGGLTLMMAQLNYGIQVATKDTIFIQNIALVGSGAHVAIFSGAKNTAIEFINCNYLLNGVGRNIIGAGLAIIADFGGPLIERERSSIIPNILNTTSIRIVNSQFLNNTSSNGAGLAYYSLYKSDIKEAVYVFIQNCTFKENDAFLGPAMFLSELKYHASYVGTQVEVIDTNITGNRIKTTNFERVQSVQQNIGIIHLHHLNMILKGNCLINKNLGTGLRADSSYVGIDGNITFSENNALRGGAMFLSTLTWLIVLPNASLYLLNNTAREAGGAIYSMFQDVSTITGDSQFQADCFLAFDYNDIRFCVDCSDLNKTGSFLKFEGNSAPAGGLIFGSSFKSCPWVQDLLPSGILPSYFQYEMVLNFLANTFPTVFSFDTSMIRPEYFQTQAETLTAVGHNDTTEFNVLPGQVFNVNFTAGDGYRQIVSNVISSFVEAETLELIPNANSTIGQSNFGLLQSNGPTELSMRVNGEEGKNLSVVVYSTDSIGVARTEISVNLGHCGLGYVFDNESLSCVCLPGLERLGVTCDEESLDLTKNQDNMWFGPVDDSGLLGAVHCPLYCDTSTNRIPFVEGEPNFDAQCDPSLYRTGVACGDCQEGWSLVLGTERCMKCTNDNISLIFLVFSLLGLLLIFGIYFLDMTITTGLLNGAIFFSNLVILYKTFLFSPRFNWFAAFISFLSLNFGIEACLYDSMEAIGRLFLHLSFPLYLFVLIIGIVLVARSRYCKVSKVGQYLKGLSTVRAITTLLVLCYVSILQITAQLYSFVQIETINGDTIIIWAFKTSISNYFESPHILLLVPVAIFLSLCLLIFSFFLLFPCLVYKSRRLSKYKPIFDAFWDPYKPKYQWWLGFRLIYRWVPFLLAILAPVPINLFFTDVMLLILLFLQLQLRPFKNYWVNLLDSLFVGILVMMFTGTLFFIAANQKQSNIDFESATAYFNLMFVLLGLILFLGILVYHTVVRFQKLKTWMLNAYSKVQRLFFKKKFTPSQSNEISLKENGEQNIGVTYSEVIVNSMELREPSMDDSFVVVRPKTPKE